MKKEIAAMLAMFVMGGFSGAIIMGSSSRRLDTPKVDLPEEFMCVVSDDPMKPDTVLTFQSKQNDSLYIRFKR